MIPGGWMKHDCLRRLSLMAVSVRNLLQCFAKILFFDLCLGRRIYGEPVVVSAVIWDACHWCRNKLVSSEEIVMLMPGAFIVCD